jgi:hypothetical protein
MLIAMRISVVLIGCSLVACAVEAPSESEVESASVIDNRLAANRLAANRLAANRLAANRLAANRLAANRLELNPISAADLLSTAEGREVLSFVVSCAIDDGETLVAEYAGTTYEFFGELGLANFWLHHPLDNKGQGWVSACLFARVNAANVAIPVSLRGPHRQLTASDEEKANWSLQEGAFYGNFFTAEDEPIDWNACRGADQALGEIGGLVERDCAEPDPAQPGLTQCGFKYAGDCGDFAAEFACKQFDDNGTYYKKCHTFPKYDPDDDDNANDEQKGGNGSWKQKRTYREVITTYVIP